MSTPAISNSLSDAYRRVLALGLSLNTYSWDQLENIRTSFEPTDWLSSLKEGDKFDILDCVFQPPLWLIATILKIEKPNDMRIKFYIHYNGWSPRYDEWIVIEYERSMKYGTLPIITPIVNENYKKLKPLHSKTPYHSVKKIENCKWNAVSQSYKCSNCNRNCCYKCFLVTVYIDTKMQKMCKQCASYSHYEYLFTLIKFLYDAMFREQQTEINIINMITNYSFSNTIICNNQITSCSHSINMDYASNIENIKYNQTTSIPKIQYIVCEGCCKCKLNQKQSPYECQVFHDQIRCPKGCDAMICNCDIKQCATYGCSFECYKCCEKNVTKCGFPGCSNKNTYCRNCSSQRLTINYCSCGKHTDIWHTCNETNYVFYHDCYESFKRSSFLKKLWKQCGLSMDDICVYKRYKRDSNKYCVLFESVYDDIGEYHMKNNFSSKCIDKKWKNNHNSTTTFWKKVNKEKKRRKKKSMRRDLHLFLKKKQYL